MGKDRLIVCGPVSSVRCKPCPILLLYFMPVFRNADVEDLFVKGSITRGWSLNAATGRIRVCWFVRVRRSRGLIRVSLIASTHLSATTTSEMLLGSDEIAGIRRSARVDLQNLGFLIYFCISIFCARVIAEKTSTAAALRFDSAKHVGQVA